MLLKSVVELSYSLPPVELESKMLEPLPKLYPDAEKGRYVAAAILLSALFAFLCLFVFLSFGLDIFSLLISTIVAALLAFLFFLAFPSFELRRKTKIMEAEMPFVLRTIGMLRNMKINFIRCLEMAADEETEISAELKAIVRDIGMGITLEKSLAKFASLFCSYTIKSALSQILSAY